MAQPSQQSEIDALKARVAELTRASAVMEEIVARTPGHFHVFDATGHLVLASAAGLRILSRYGTDVMGKNWRELDFPPDLATFFEAELLEVAKSGSSVRRKMRLPTDRGPRDFEYRLLPIRDDASIVTHVLLMARDMTETRAAEAAVRQRLRIERLVASLSQRFLSISPGEVEDEIDRSLERIGEFEDVDRSYLFEMSEDGLTTTNTHEWVRDGISPEIQNLQKLPVSEFTWFFDVIGRGDNLHVRRTADIPDEGATFRGMLETQGIKSLVCIPVMRSGKIIAFLGFDSVRREKRWSDDDCHLLRAAGEILITARDRARMDLCGGGTPRALRAIAASVASGVAYIDLAEQFHFASDAFRRGLGLEEQDFVGRSLREVLGEKAYQAARHIVRRAADGEEGSFTVQERDGDSDCSVTLHPFREAGTVVGFAARMSKPRSTDQVPRT